MKESCGKNKEHYYRYSEVRIAMLSAIRLLGQDR